MEELQVIQPAKNPFIRNLSVEVLSNGKALEIANQDLAEVVQDVIKRPYLNETRVVILRIEIKPGKPKDTGEFIPEVDWSVKSSVPGKKGITQQAFIQDKKLKINTAIQQTFIEY